MLGMAVAKLFAAELLSTPWVLHLDVFRTQIGAILTGRSRPDLVGQDDAGNWIALECMGRVSAPDEGVKAKAKEQAQRIVSVDGVRPSFAIGAITYFRNDVLQFFWRDPKIDEKVKRPIRLHCSDGVWDHYYAPVLALIESGITKERDGIVWRDVTEADLSVGMHACVLSALRRSGASAREVASRMKSDLTGCRADGVVVKAGESWMQPFAEVVRGVEL
jgi:hypothetical protein